MPAGRRLTVFGAAALASSLLAAGCGRAKEKEAPARAPSDKASAAAPTSATSAEADELEPAPEATPMPVGLAPIVQPFKGDFDGMVKRRMIRVLTVQNPVLYLVDRGREIGLTYEAARAFEKQVNEKLGNKVVLVH